MAYTVYKMDDFDIKKPPVKLLYITRSEYGKDWLSNQHSHHFTELFYIVKGKGFFVLPGREISVKENDLVIVNPFITHTEKSNQSDSLQYIALGIDGLSFSLAESKDPDSDILIYQGIREEMLFFLNKIVVEVQHKKLGYETICQNILEVLIMNLQRKMNFRIKETSTKSMNKDVAFTKAYIEHNYRDKITLDKLAEIRHINKYYLAHTFKKDVGISPIEYLNQIRVKEAKVLLESTDLKVADIAIATGFSSQSFFAQTFRHLAQQTPSQYRKLAKELKKDHRKTRQSYE